MVWYGIAIGAVVGSGAGGAVDNDKNGDKDHSGGQGLFSLFGHQVWLYLGGIVGWGENIGLYLTTGPMIGYDPDWAIGGGVHIRKFGVGIVLPIRQMINAAQAHPDKISYLIDQGNLFAYSAQHYAGVALHSLSQMGALERMIS